MDQYHLNLHGYYLYYENEQYQRDREVFNYLETLDQNEIKTFFDAAYADGEADFQTPYGSDYKIMYDYSSKMYTLQKR